MVRNMKAVSVLIEYMLLFMFGIIIFISSVSVFTNYNSYFNSVSVNDQLIEISEYVSSNIIKLAEMGSGEDSSVTLKIPKNIGTEGGLMDSIRGEEYILELSNQGLNLTSTLTKVSKYSGLYSLNETFSLSGKAVSGSGSVIIYKTGNQIIIS